MASLDSFTIRQHPIHDDTIDAFFFDHLITGFQRSHPGDMISAGREIFLHGIADIIGIFNDKDMHYLLNEMLKLVFLFGTLSMEIVR
jgi:hypothetical protein